MNRSRHALKVLLISSFLIAPANFPAQKRSDSAPGGPATTRRDTLLSREADLENRELRLRLLSESGKTRTPPSPDDRKMIVSQIFNDFEHIQIINREMMQASSSLNAPAFKRISTLADQMNKCAKRLKTNLGIPDVDDEKTETDHALAMSAPQFKASILMLDRSVKSFVTNPLFKDPRVTDVRQLTNLRQDISNIIELSHLVKKVAGKLRN